MKYQDFYLKYPKELGSVQEGKSAFIYNKNVEIDLPKMDFWEYNIFLSTGIDTTDKEKIVKKMLEFIMKISCYTDIRIWPNRMTGLSGNFQNSVSAGMASGMSAFDSNLFGTISSLKIYDMIDRIKDANNLEETLMKERPLYGFSRPNKQDDERRNFFINEFGMDIILKFDEFKILFKAEDFLFEKKKVKLNISSIFTVLLRILGLKKNDIRAFGALLFSGSLPLIYMYNRENIKNGSFLPIKSEDIIYEGEYEIGRKWEDD